MGKKCLTTTVTCELEFIKDCTFRGFHKGFTVKTGGFSIPGSFQFAKSTLIVVPLVRQKFPAVHTSYWNYHRVVIVVSLYLVGKVVFTSSILVDEKPVCVMLDL